MNAFVFLERLLSRVGLLLADIQLVVGLSNCERYLLRVCKVEMGHCYSRATYVPGVLRSSEQRACCCFRLN